MMLLNNQKTQHSLMFVLAFSMFLVNFQRAYGFNSINTASHGGLRLNLHQQRPTYRVVLGGASTLTEGSAKGVATLGPEDDELLQPSEAEAARKLGPAPGTPIRAKYFATRINFPPRPLGQLFDIRKPGGGLGVVFGMNDKGAVVVDAIRDQAAVAVKKQFQLGDEIISLNGVAYRTDIDLASAIRNTAVDAKLLFRVRHIPQVQAVAEPVVDTVKEVTPEAEVQAVAEPVVGTVKEVTPEAEIKSEEPVAEPFIAEIENEIGIEESVPEIFAESDIKIKSEEPVAEPFIAEIENEIGIEESVPEIFAESDIKPSGSIRFAITKSSDRLGITFETEDGVIKVYGINANAVESVAKNFQVGDIVLAMNGLKYSHDAKLATPIREMEIGGTMVFDILRDGQTQSEEPLEEPIIAEVKNEIGIEESVQESSAKSDITAQSEEPLAEATFDENKNEDNAKAVATVKEEKAPSRIPVKSVLKNVFSKLGKVLKLLSLAVFFKHFKKSFSSQS